jgi:hypothetical protein
MMTFAENLFLKLPAFARIGVATGVLALALTGCAIGKDSNLAGACAGASSEAVAAQATAFGSTLHPVFGKNSCNNCHDGSGKAPYSFAAGDPSTAVASALKFVDLTSPDNSRFVSKVGTELHQCGGNCAAIASEMKTQIAKWATMVADVPVPRCDVVGTLITSAPKQITQADLADGNIKQMRWDMNATSLGLGTIWFQAEVRLYQAASGSSKGAFTIRAPMVATATKRLRVGSIQFLINGRLDSGYSNFAGTSFIVDSNPFDVNSLNWDFPFVSNAQQLIAWENSPGGDSVAIQIDVQPTEEAPDTLLDEYVCYERPNFTANVESILTSRCTSCHGVANSAAANAYPLMATVDRCVETLKKSNYTSPSSSLIFRKARDNSNHPGGAPLASQTAEINRIISWIQAEAARQ